MRNIVLCLIICLAGQLKAQQTFQWGIKAGGTNTDVINDIVSLGNDIFITGRFTGSFASGNQSAGGAVTNDIYFLRLNSKGGTKWLRTLSGEGINDATRLAVSGKKILMGGSISETVNQDKKTFDGQGKAVFVSLWNEQGKTEWLTRLEYSGHATLDVLEVKADGSILAGGLLQGEMKINGNEIESPNAKRAWVATFSANGEPLEARLSFGEGHHRLVSATVDGQGNQYLLYSVSGHFSMQEDSLISFPKKVKSGLVLQKEKADGEALWNRTITCPAYVEGVKVISNKDNQLLICANYNKEIQAGETRINTNSQLETVLLCFNSEGEQAWHKTLKSPVKARAMDMQLTGNGNILIAGYFRQSYSFNKEEFFSENTGGDLFLLQFDEKGELVWHDEPGREAVSFCKAFTLDQTGNIVFAGGFRDELSMQDKKLKSAGKEDILVAKYFNCLQKEAHITGEEPICEGKEIMLTVTGDFQSYQWNDGQWSDVYAVSNPGTYIVTAYDKKGCSAKDTVVITEASETELGLPEVIELGEDEEEIVSASAGFASYGWSDGLEGAERKFSYVPALDSAVFCLVAETFEGCRASDSVKVYYDHGSTASSLKSANLVVKAWPNPVDTKLNWTLKVDKPQELVLSLSDSKSVLIRTETIENYIPGSVHTLNMESLAGGNYLLCIKVGETVYNQKIVKR